MSTLFERGRSRTKFSCTGEAIVLCPLEAVIDVESSSTLLLLSKPVKSMVLVFLSIEMSLQFEGGFLFGGGDIDRFLIRLMFSGIGSTLGLFLVTNASIERTLKESHEKGRFELDA